VPGISIPPALMAAMSSASDADALEIGVAAAQELSSHIRKIAAGLYLMPPVNGHAIAARVFEAV